MKALYLACILLILIPNSIFAQITAEPIDEMDTLLANVKPAPPWQHLAESEILRFYYDPGTLKRVNKSIVRVWTGTWPTQEGIKNARWRQERINVIEADGLSAAKYRAYYRSKELIECDCENDKIRTLQTVDYDDKGNIIESLELKGTWHYVIPDSVGFRMLKNLCNPNYKPPKDSGSSNDPEEDMFEFETEPSNPPRKESVKPQPKGSDPFVATYVGGNRAPEITIKNDSSKTLNLALGGVRYQINPSNTERITLEEGHYNFRASAIGVSSLDGQKTFQRGYAYSWTFYIVTRTVPGRTGISIPGRRRRRP